MVDESDMEAECSGFLSVLTEKKHLGCDKVMEEEESYRLMEQSPKETREISPAASFPPSHRHPLILGLHHPVPGLQEKHPAGLAQL